MFHRIPARYLLPNCLTALSLVLALAAIMQASRSNFETAAWLIVWCALLDIADGKVAGWVNAHSEFGGQLDSLADLLAFCAAPAILVYFLLTSDPRYAPLFEAGPVSIALQICVAMYVLCGALRLARYNSGLAETGYDQFLGLPTTISGAIVATYLLVAWRWSLPAPYILASVAVLAVCGSLMISNIRYPKSTAGKRVSPSIKLAGLAVVYGLAITQSFPAFLLLAALAYPALGFVLARLPERVRLKLGY